MRSMDIIRFIAVELRAPQPLAGFRTVPHYHSLWSFSAITVEARLDSAYHVLNNLQ